jgi:GDP-4-dehydro-6-deoxy-D-mannose reductase
MIDETKPDALIHLAGLAHTKDTEANLPLLFDVNVAGVSHLATAMGRHSQTRPPALILVSSAFVYGGDVKTGQLICNEDTPINPRGSYGFSKAAAESSGLMYGGPRLKIYVVRPFNHIGPGQHPSFVIPGFAAKIHAASSGGIIETGSLEAYRDFTDVRDIVRGYRLILEKRPQETFFVFGSGKSVQIKTVFDTMCKLSGKDLRHTLSPNLLRSNDQAELVADYSRAKKILGWEPEIAFEQSLADVMRDAR